MKHNRSMQRIIQHFDAFADRFKNADLLLLDPAAQYEFAQVTSCLDLTKKVKIIDLGCGIGKYSLLLAKRGHDVTAIDVSQKSLDLVKTQAKRHHISTIQTLRHDFSSAIRKNAYDIGICISTYHAVSASEDERKTVLANFVQSLKPDGRLLLVEPNPLNPLFYFFYLLYPGVQRENIKNFLGSNPFRLRRILSSLGMKDIRIRYVGFLPLRFLKRFAWVRYINEVINNVPILQWFSAFSYITAHR